MQRIKFRSSKNFRGVIVWDFDGVLFDTERYRSDNRSVWIKHGVREEVIAGISEDIRRMKFHFSIAQFVRLLRKEGHGFSEKFIRGIFHKHLVERNYYSHKTDKLLHRLRKKGFIQMILSMGSSSFQRKKMFVGCGSDFRKHFLRILVTTRPKFMTLLKIRKKFPGMPLVFVDDTKEHLDLVKKHAPDIKTIRYSNLSGESLRGLERKILTYARK